CEEGDIVLKEVYEQKSMSNDMLRDNIALVYLKWEKLVEAEISRYRVYYLGTDGKEEEPVWDSVDEHAEDPVYDPEAPEAYLDLGNELGGYVDSVGEYYF